jgi:hypothetical protein
VHLRRCERGAAAGSRAAAACEREGERREKKNRTTGKARARARALTSPSILRLSASSMATYHLLSRVLPCRFCSRKKRICAQAGENGQGRQERERERGGNCSFKRASRGRRKTPRAYRTQQCRRARTIF